MPAIKRLIYFVLVAIAAILAQFHFANAQTYWIIWSALTLSLITTGNTFSEKITIQTLTGVIASVGVFITGFAAGISLPLLILCLVVITFLCALTLESHPEHFLSILIVNLFAILAGFLPYENLVTEYNIILGTAIAVFLQVIFVPHFETNEFNARIDATIKCLGNLSQHIFSCFLEPEHANNVYLFERRLHKQKNRCMQMLLQLNEIGHISRMNDVILSLERIYDVLISCSLLRFRVSDQTIFAVCFNEFNSIAEEIDKNFAEMVAVFNHKNPFMNTTGLSERIDRLEENYQSVLQVTAREPLVFLLFISSLRSLCNEMTSFYEIITTETFISSRD